MSDKTIKHFVFSRFFPSQSQDYIYNVLAPKFLKTQLPLAKNMFKSLENQTNKNFELVFLMHPKLFDNPKKYEFVFSTLKNSTTLPLKFIKPTDIPALMKDAFNNYDFVIQTGTDMDDFVFKNAVADIQSKVNECDSILAYGYCKGYTYFSGVFYPAFCDFKGGGVIGDFQSMIFKSSIGKNLNKVYFVNHGHHKWLAVLRNLLEENGIEFQERMFQRDTSTEAYIYFRHKSAQEYLKKVNPFSSEEPLTNPVSSREPLTNFSFTKKQLEEEFGFFYEVNSIE